MPTLKLPPEIILNVLDQLVGFSTKQQPIFDPSSPVTKTLRALALTSRSTYPVATKFLYRYCLYLGDGKSYACLARTLGIDADSNHPQLLACGEAGRNDELWNSAKIPQHITSMFLSPMSILSADLDNDRSVYAVGLPQIVDLFNIIGATLKRLILNAQPIHFSLSEIENARFLHRAMNIFPGMPHLEELVASYDVPDYFGLPPPNLKKLAITTQDLHDVAMRFCFSVSTLQILVILRPVELSAADINNLFTAYKGQSLDIVLVDVNSNHRTPKDTRSWNESNTVRIWEVDVPTSFYGDDDDLILCDNWVWTHAVKGTLWTQEKRRMASWSEIQRRLAGPVHQIMDDI